MQRSPDLPTTKGVFALIHAATRAAYVGVCANLRHRAGVWAYNFKKRDQDPNYELPIKSLPKYPSAEWSFFGWPGQTASVVRAALVARGYTLLNPETREREKVVWQGREQSLLAWSKELNLPYSRVYYRWKAGRPLEEVFGP